MDSLDPFDRVQPPAADPEVEVTIQVPRHSQEPRGRWSRLVGIAFGFLFAAALGIGAWGYYSQERAVAATTEQQRDFIPQVRVATVRASDGDRIVSLPATTSAFSVANIFARSSGYIDKREVDIGDRVKEGQLLAEIVAPEIDHQIAQGEATLAQLNATLRQAQANRDLASVTWQRDEPLVSKGWVTAQQGTVDVQTLKANEAAVGVAQANVAAQQAQLQVLRQQKIYQRVVAPFNGVITQRNIDVGSLVQADATSGTFMFTIMQGNVIRTQVYVPQDAAFGLRPGLDAVVHVPEIPDRTFPGTVTRIADALQPGSRTLLTEIDIPNASGILTPGIYCTIDLHLPRTVPSLIVPADAIIFNSKGLQVAVIENGAAHIRKIEVARDLGKEVEIRQGIKSGEEVILNPSVDLVDGRKVQTRSNAAGPNLAAETKGTS
jgi:RND family efflux transporter MFP subunit